MTLTPHAATIALRDDIRAALPKALVTLLAEQATPALLAGSCAVVVGTPRLTCDHAAVTYTWKIAVIGAPLADLEAAGANLDTTLTALDAVPALVIESADPITWAGSQTAQAPAYLLTTNRTYTRN